MSTAIAWFLPRASAASVVEIDAFIKISIFCGVGLLLSLSIIILDQRMPGEWF